MQPFKSITMPRRAILRTLFVLYLLSGPLLMLWGGFVVWKGNPHVGAESHYLLHIYPWGLLLLFLCCLIRRAWLGLGAILLAPLLFLGALLLSAFPMESLGFAYYIYGDKQWLQNHCHPISFVQDGKTYAFGVCDVAFDPDGQIDMSGIVYDTSGDIMNDADAREKNHTKDRKEFVDAVRKFFNGDPSETFESSNFYTRHLYQEFYVVGFNDSDAFGFTLEYGLPPPNPKNHYKNFLYPPNWKPK